MKRVSVFALAAITAWTLQSCGGSNTNNNTGDSVDSAKTINETVKPVDEKSSEFAIKAASGGMMEVALGKLAQEKGMNQRVKDFGAMMDRDHTKANDELKNLAAAKNITLPATAGEDHQKHIDNLSKKNGKDFDKDYIKMMVDDHKEDIDLFEKAAKDAQDPEIKAFAENTLPTLRAHLDSAKAVWEVIK
ncbi:DUF4142 domain-containing protein [Chitinophaga pendula]|uniref:DUF4142 domain-containing protein n=1 Tax=Chitinophaga TaxID=79328 RepID=UPI000BB0A6D2|nr:MULTISPECIES: DUF4142 domain-containing protein [Chitinophaga]ASZ15005.1 DUF305 domain-containing protein [Chitinophaga sp. MD30]UCJ09606.1 DUF4142 domain-containing protein [Chitinophaga pendula]